jgi:hypothetical protein
MKMGNELAECARINFENFEIAFPMAKQHPYYVIAKAQLDEALGGVKMEDNPRLKKTEIVIERVSGEMVVTKDEHNLVKSVTES